MPKGRKIEDPWVEVKGAQLLLYLVRWLSVIWWPLHLQSHICNLWRSSHKNMDFNFISAGDLCFAIFTSIFSTWGLVKCHPKNLSSGNICKIVFPSPLQFSLWRLALNIMMIIRHLLAFDSPLANSFRLIRKLRGLHWVPWLSRASLALYCVIESSPLAILMSFDLDITVISYISCKHHWYIIHLVFLVKWPSSYV